MAIYEKRVRIVHRYEYSVPGALPGGHGVPIAELHKAIERAEVDYKAAHGTEPRHDDWLRVFACDEEIVAVFEVERVEGAL